MKWTLCVLFVLLFSCVPHGAKVNYIGKTFPETQHVDVYLNKEEITKKYKIIGRALGESQKKQILAQDLQDAIIELAKEKGAHAIVLGAFTF